MNSNFFFKKKNIKINQIFSNIKFEKNFIINDIKSLQEAKKNDLTFFDSIKYKLSAQQTNAGVCITTSKLKDYLPKSTELIVVKNVLFELSNILKKIYKPKPKN